MPVVYSAVRFENEARELIHVFKYGGRDYLASWIAECLLNAVELDPAHYDCVVPVPMPYLRECRRGYNQAALLASIIAIRWSKPLVEGWISSGFFQLSQTRFGRVARLTRAARRFRLKRRGPFPYANVLLVDDVKTTGATLRRCAFLLKQAGAERIDGLVFARDELRSK